MAGADGRARRCQSFVFPTPMYNGVDDGRLEVAGINWSHGMGWARMTGSKDCLRRRIYIYDDAKRKRGIVSFLDQRLLSSETGLQIVITNHAERHATGAQ